MAFWQPFAGWMDFSRLDGGSPALDRCYAVAYRITGEPDTWSHRLNAFKAKDADALRRAHKLVHHAVPPLLSKLGINRSDALFIPALSSGETAASRDGVLTRLAEACAASVNSIWEARALTKTAHAPLHKIYGTSGRQAELAKANYQANAARIGRKHVFVVDDLVTRGETLSRIAEAIQKVRPGTTVRGLVLGKTERKSWMQTGSNDHVPKSFDEAWISNS